MWNLKLLIVFITVIVSLAFTQNVPRGIRSQAFNLFPANWVQVTLGQKWKTPFARSSRYNWVQVSDIQNPQVCEEMSNKNHIVTFQNSSSYIKYDTLLKGWAFQQFDGKPQKESRLRRPASWRFDTSDGDGGSVTLSYDLRLTAKEAFGLSTEISGSILSGLELALSEKVTFKGAYSCDVKKGDFAQLYIRPVYYVIPPGRRSKVTCSKNRTHSVLEFVGEEESTPSFEQFWLGLPIVECATGSNSQVLDNHQN